ncbi:minor histocompatibility antigen H13 [Contarinia nasturtii]|uniref:minor histocompatibility antigen H13 n=1 Tax=Contarinia nasturtii TaxID=265458 RepID=UPI0012D446B2|nr:minor histocompatibility antigen H13 [Contarinia nasturtii]
MADVAEKLLQENATDSVSGAKSPASPEGAAVAYGSLIIMAMLPIFFGAIRSVKHQKDQKDSGKKLERMNSKDALLFPVIASVALFGLYIVFKLFSKDHINLLLTAYFFFLEVLALAHLLSPIIGSLIPSSIPNISYHIGFTKGKGNQKQDLIDYDFSTHDIVCLIIALIIGIWYLLKKHWIANNLFGVAFAVNGVELLHLNNVVTGLILLSGLFVYDVFWVFGTNVMVTVAKSFDAPIKLVFPQDLLVNGFNATNFAMLGLGDIVIPGIFIALLLRFDNSLKRKSRTYFYTAYVAYFLGLMLTILVMHIFRHAQPALLYLVPACAGAPLLIALIKGDLKLIFAYQDNPEEKKSSKKNKDQNISGNGSNQQNNKESKKKDPKKSK